MKTKENLGAQETAPKQKSILSKVLIGIGGLILLSGLLMIFRVGSATYNFIKDPSEAVSQIPKLIGSPLDKDGSRTNILLLGAGDMSYDEGSELTDTIMLVSLNHEDSSISMISIPRDLGVEIPGYGVTRVNVLYKLAKNRFGEEHAFDLIVPTIEQVSGQEIHYYTKVDFIGFKKIVNALGGVTVEVDNAFTDYQFPDGNFGYMTVSFEAGAQWMDGDRALQYVRSRHGDNEEGSDFARAARQQKLIAALKDKVLSADLLNEEKRMIEIIEAVNDHYETNLTLKEMISLAAFAKNLSGNSIHHMVLKEGPGEMLYTPDEITRNDFYEGMAILLPDGNSFKNIQRNIENFLADPSVLDAGLQIEVLNGSGVPGLANKVATLLGQNGYKIFPIYGIRNSSYGSYENSYLYDHDEMGANLFIVEKLQHLLGIKRVLDKNPEPRYHDVDLTVVLGKDFYLEGLDELYEGKASIVIDVDLTAYSPESE